jgi:hypothetical protein
MGVSSFIRVRIYIGLPARSYTDHQYINANGRLNGRTWLPRRAIEQDADAVFELVKNKATFAAV